MSADILQFLPRANPKAERAFWKGPDGKVWSFDRSREPDREAILKAGAIEIESVKVLDQGRPSDSNPDGERA
jgi:hypothetical protein